MVGTVVGAGAYWLWRYFKPEHSPLVLNKAVVVITGASSGIGRAYAMAFARRGARIVLAARRAELLDAVRREIEPYAADVLTVQTDVNDEGQRQALIDATLARFGQIDVLVNNAGVILGGMLHNATDAEIERLVDVNFTSVMQLTRLALPTMLSRQKGWIVNVASIAGKFGDGTMPAYAATKWGVLGFSSGLRRQLEGTGVQVSSVLPGWTQSEMTTAKASQHLFTAEDVAERTIEGLLQGERDILIERPITRVFAVVEQLFPRFVDWYWRANLTPDALAEAERLGR
jgi:short-subunit dehydrogenase